MALPSVTMLVSPARGTPMVELVAGPSRASQSDSTLSQHAPRNAANVVLVPDQVADGPRQANIHTTSKDREAGSYNKQSLRDSACILTPPSILQPKATAPLPPSISMTTVSASGNLEQPNARTSPCANSIDNAAPTSNVRGSVKSEPTLAAETAQHRAHPQNPAENHSVWPRGLSQQAFLLLYHERARIQLQDAIDSGVFKWPPKDLERINEEMEENKTGYRPAPKNYAINAEITEALFEKHSEFWGDFVPQIEEERSKLSSLKQEVIDKIATKKAVGKTIIQVRMHLRAKVANKGQRAGRSHGAPFPSLQSLLDKEKRLEEEIPNIYAEWRERVVNLYHFIEESFRPEFHQNQVEEEILAAERKERAKMTEYHRIMRIAGWGEIPYPGETAPSQPSRPAAVDTVVVPAWFEAVDAAGVTQLSGEGPRQRYIKFLNTLHDLEGKMREDTKRALDPPPEPKRLRKSWHESKPDWPYPSWQKNGGWWVCRTGPGASAAEERCKECPIKRDTRVKQQEQPSQKKPAASETYGKIVTELRKALGPQMNKDKEEVKERMRVEKDIRQAAKKSQPVYRNGWDGGYLPGRS